MDGLHLPTDPVTLKAMVTSVTLIVVEIVKRMSVVPQPDRWLPAIGVAFGTIIGVLVGIHWLEAILVAAAATGLFEFGKRSLAGRTA